MKFFSLDSAFHKYGTLLFDFIMLNVFWFFTCIGTLGILMPLANASMFNSMHHAIIEEDGYVMKEYFAVFRYKFLRSLGLSLMALLMYGITGFNIYAVWIGLFDASFLLPLYLVFFIEVTMTLTFAYALMAETDMKIKQLIKYGFLLSNKHFFVSLGCLASIIAVLFFTYYYNNLIIIFIATAPAFWVMTKLIYGKVLPKYYLDKLI